MKWLNLIPLFRVVIPFSLGIVFAFYYPFPVPRQIIFIFLSIVPIIFFFVRLRNIHIHFFYRWSFGALLYLLFFVLGVLFTNYRVERFHFNHIEYLLKSTHHPIGFKAVIASEPVINDNSIKAVLEIQSIKLKRKWVLAGGKCLVYFKRDMKNSLKYGDEIVFSKIPSVISPPSNFNEFDYKHYLEHHYIYQRVYLSKEKYRVIGNNPPSLIIKRAIDWRNFLLQQYRDFGIEGENLALLSALTLGKKESLTPELKLAYSSAGAMHVLAVSGLHVGIIFMVLQFVLSWMDKTYVGKIVKAVLLIFSVWFYAFITALSPSVIRAATMFTFVIIALSFKRASNIYNTLALSAIIILLFKPFMVLDVGFQLSYLAVVGIIYLHPHLYNLLSFRSWILDQAWNITCVSLSAQLVTAPLGILYFHQFPTYFLFSNLIVIPGAFLIMGLAIVFQATALVPYVGEATSWLLKTAVTTLNHLVHYLEHLPAALIAGLDISVFETWIFYFVIGGFTVWLTQYNRKALLFGLACILVFTLSQTVEKWEQLHQKEITIYHTGKDIAIEFTNGLNSTLYANQRLISNTDKMQFYIFHHWWERGIANINYQKTDTCANAYLLGNTRVLHLTDSTQCSSTSIQEFAPDIVYINTYRCGILDSLAKTSLSPVVVVAHTSGKVARKVHEICVSKNWEYFDLRQTGAVKIVLDDHFRPKTWLANRQIPR